MVLSLVTLTDL